MRKSPIYPLLGIVAVGVCILLLSRDAFREPVEPTETVRSAERKHDPPGRLTIQYPLDATLFPPDIAAPTFRWQDGNEASDAWLVAVALADQSGPIRASCSDRHWTPSDEQWETIKLGSVGEPAEVTIWGVNRRAEQKVLSTATISISTSHDEVGAPIFYREVNLPFIDAVKDPSRIRWRFGTVASKEQPPIVLEKLAVCGNCHSFSADGAVLGMDVDYANDKGSYMVDVVREEIVLDSSNIISWGDYRREDGEPTFGLLSQVSPDGRYVASTVQDRSVFVPKDDLAFSQLFFPIKGILVIYDRQTKSFTSLPGADDKQFVQSNPTWSPDGKHIVFARSKVHRLKNPGGRKTVLLDKEACSEFLSEGKTFLFDLYRIPFNEGKGGRAEPIEGASRNGMSNYFARYSPDGKWIVFCKAKTFMLLQPDSELFVMPAEGGKARRMRCNTSRMNSWHSWSPNGKWMVFSSKCNSAYTQLFLTHFDEQGESSPAVLLSRFTSPDRAANIPEFVNADPGAIKRIRQRFVDDASYLRAALLNARHGYHNAAIREFRQALQINPENVEVHVALARSLARQGESEEALKHLGRAIELKPQSALAHEAMGNVLAQQRKLPEAAECFRKALRIDPRLPVAHFRLGVVLMDLGQFEEAGVHLAEAVRLDPDDPKAACSLGHVLSREGKLAEAAVHYAHAVELDPDLLMALLPLASIRATSSEAALRNGPEAIALATRACELTSYRDPTALLALSEGYAEVGRFPDALLVARQALAIAEAGGSEGLIGAIRQRMDFYERGEPPRQSPPRESSSRQSRSRQPAGAGAWSYSSLQLE